jgi:hypothetical protein
MAQAIPQWEHVRDAYEIDYGVEYPERDWAQDEMAVRYGFEQRFQREGDFESNREFLARGWNGPFADVEAVVRTGWSFAERG